jgi:isoquinoline 1-oxidoreductase
MGTFGSRSTPHLAPKLRRVAASARELFIDRAAAQWGVPREDLLAANSQVSHPSSGRSLSYTDLLPELASGQAADLAEPWSEDALLTPPGEWSVAGKAAFRLGGRDLVTGRHRYTSDLSVPGMLYGAVLRPPSNKAALVSLDTSKAEQMPGVTVVRDGDFVGVVAPDRAKARRVIAAMEARWDASGEDPEPDSATVYDYIKAHPSEPEGYHRWAGPAVNEVGSLEAGRAAGRTFEARYTVPYIAHAPLETRAALAIWEDDHGSRHLTVWTGTQRPFGVRDELVAAFDMPEDRVRVIVPDTGAAYGGKHTGEAAIEAARLARAVGRPVKVVWSRQEEFTSAYLRPAGLIEISSTVDENGRITAWEYHNYNSGPAAMNPAYAIPNQLVAFHTTLSPLRQGSYRALAATANHFARESHIDDLAHMAGMDPLDFRLLNLQENPAGGDTEQKAMRQRISAVLKAAGESFGWASRERAEGHGYGLSCGTEKGSCVATCVEVVCDPATGQVRIVRVVEAFECGAIINPEGLANQVEGAIVQAIGGALLEKIEFDRGAVSTDRFSRYRVPRFRDMPEIEVVLLDRKDIPSAGAGETPIVGLAPALANAIFDATGTRLRDLPLRLPARG